MSCSSVILSFQMTEPRAKHTEDYAPCSIVNGQKTKESACVQADWQVHRHPGNKTKINVIKEMHEHAFSVHVIRVSWRQ